jgi:hypothetical protein
MPSIVHIVHKQILHRQTDRLVKSSGDPFVLEKTGQLVHYTVHITPCYTVAFDHNIAQHGRTRCASNTTIVTTDHC